MANVLHLFVDISSFCSSLIMVFFFQNCPGFGNVAYTTSTELMTDQM
uniref:Hypotheticial protein n=1 Tax=Schistosoma japonicum TaxID=6182 RepID=C1LKF1_SCHJA|nr:hypotheticial protein [Schistosoma japonicum]